MTTHLIHGFNVWDGGAGSVGRLLDYLDFGTPARLHSYGWVGLLLLRWRNASTVKEIRPLIEAGDVLVGHSNGCLVCWELVQAGARPAAVVCIQPSLRRDARWPEGLPVLCLYNRRDWVVSLGRFWARFITVTQPWRNRHGWGAAGRHGFDQASVTSWDTSQGPIPARGHSGIFQHPALVFWGYTMRAWLRDKLA